MKLLVANRGEIALRIVRAARERDIPTVAVCAADEEGAPHTRLATEVVTLPASGPAAYLDAAALVAGGTGTGCTHVHPGYGFLSEDPGFARACEAAGLVFVGPSPEVLEVFGNKVRARQAAAEAGVPVLDATGGGATLEDVRRFLEGHPDGIVIKAQSAGGGRGLRVVEAPADLATAYERCRAEAEGASGRASVFAEELFTYARHIEVQVVGSADGRLAMAVGDRDCSVQRNLQKLVEIAPAQYLADDLRRDLHAAAVRLCSSVGLAGLGTVEFLVSGRRFAFLEVNPRLQVEHTVTEEVTGLDLVGLALDIAGGGQDSDVALAPGVASLAGGPAAGTVAAASGIAIQCRLNAETLDGTGRVTPGAGTLSAFVPPTGRGVRVETSARPGLAVTGRYDSLLAKIVTHAATASFPAAAAKAASAMAETVVAGVATNRNLLRAVVEDGEFRAGPVTTQWLVSSLPRLVPAAAEAAAGDPEPPAVAAAPTPRPQHDLEAGETAVAVHLLGTIVALAEPGAVVPAGGDLAVLEAMKMHHSVVAPEAVVVSRVFAAVGETVEAGDVLLATRPAGESGDGTSPEAVEASLDHRRDDLAETRARHDLTTDEGRVERLAKTRARGRRTARENIADLVDPGTFQEYGPLALAASRRGQPLPERIVETAGDGVIGGTATVNGDLFESGTDAMVISYDYSVMAGTQGRVGHDKTDRLLTVANRRNLPVVWFAEGGGGRPNDFDTEQAGLTGPTFRYLAHLRGRAPLVSIVSGRCFAGNAAVAGLCDVIIATPDANIGMGGPAMIEGGGLGKVTPEEVGPVAVQTANGVIDLVAAGEAEAVALAKRYLGFFQGRTRDWEAPDARRARHAVPENRLRAYDVRAAIHAIADVGSVLELRPTYGHGMVTALLRVEGHPLALFANDSRHLGGAVDAVGARKAVEFLRIARDFRLPVLSLVDTPGFMVGPAAEEHAQVRIFSELFAAVATLTGPTGSIIVRKGYGLGAIAMTMGDFHAPEFTVAWPTGEIGPMGLEGAVRLASRRELEAIADPDERQAHFEKLVAVLYEQGKALNAVAAFEFDDVIDPADSRRWILRLCGRGEPAR